MTHGQSTATPEASADVGPSASERRRARRERRARAVEGAVRDFYQEVDFEDYEAAWGRLTMAAQAELGGHDTWRAGYDLSVSTRVSNLTAVEVSPRFAVVAFRLRSEDVDRCANTVVQRFAGRWQLARAGRYWRGASLTAEKIAGETPVTNIEDCTGDRTDSQPLSPGDAPNYVPSDDYGYDDDSDLGDGYRDAYEYEYDFGATATEDFGRGSGRIGSCEDGTLSDSIGI